MTSGKLTKYLYFFLTNKQNSNYLDACCENSDLQKGVTCMKPSQKFTKSFA